MSTFKSARTFQCWEYRVSHRQLLIRSPRALETTTNFDIAFYGVKFFELATSIKGIELGAASSGDRARVGGKCRELRDDDTVYCLQSEAQRFFVVATGHIISENTMDIFQSPFDVPPSIGCAEPAEPDRTGGT